MLELHLLALRAVVCAGFGVSLDSSNYGPQSVYVLKLGFLNRFVVASAALLLRGQIRNSTDTHFK